MDTLESKVAKTILQEKTEVKVGKDTFEAAQPTIATLIEVSKLISKLPAIQMDSENLLFESLSIAKDTELIGDIIAMLIVGAQAPQKIKINLFKYFSKAERKRKRLARKILFEMTPSEVNTTLILLLSGMNIDFFFGIITSLFEVNLLRQSRG